MSKNHAASIWENADMNVDIWTSGGNRVEAYEALSPEVAAHSARNR